MKKTNKAKIAGIARKRERRNQQQSRRAERQRAALTNARAPIELDLSSCESEYILSSDPRPQGRLARNESIIGDGNTPLAGSGLSDEFMKKLKWSAADEGNGPHEAPNGVAVQMSQRVGHDYYAIRNNRLIAYDRSAFSEEANAEYSHEAAWFWNERVNETWRPKIDFVKSGLAIWKSINFPMSVEASKFFLSMKECDGVTAEAFHAALFNAVNTSPVSVNWEAVILALATFVHVHPAFAEVIEDGEFHQPFGENTGWKLVKPLAA